MILVSPHFIFDESHIISTSLAFKVIGSEPVDTKLIFELERRLRPFLPAMEMVPELLLQCSSEPEELLLIDRLIRSVTNGRKIKSAFHLTTAATLHYTIYEEE